MSQLRCHMSNNFNTAMRMVYGALAQGRSYMVNRLEGDCTAFEFYAFRGAERWFAGDIASLRQGPITLKIDLGAKATIRLIHNGQVKLETNKPILTTINESGVYRVEAIKKSLPWVLSNPLYVIR